MHACHIDDNSSQYEKPNSNTLNSTTPPGRNEKERPLYPSRTMNGVVLCRSGPACTGLDPKSHGI
eukprot:4003994-Prymnesium_polylepis.1